MKRVTAIFIFIFLVSSVFGQYNIVLSHSNITGATARIGADFTDHEEGEVVRFITFRYVVEGTTDTLSAAGDPYNFNHPDPDPTHVHTSATNLIDLTGNTTYAYRVRYYDGTTHWSSSSTFTTLDYTSAEVFTEEATNIKAATATLNGMVVMGSETPLEDVYFQWGLTTSYGNNTTKSDYSVSFTDVSANISGLTSGSTYHFRIAGTDLSSGIPKIVYGDDKQFTATAAPVISTFDSHTTSQFDVNWTFSGTASTYYLDVATDSDFNNMVSGFDNKDVGNVLTATVNGLTAGTTYYCRLRAGLSGGGTTGNSATDNTITICDAPTASAASAIGVAQFTANWNTQTGASSYLLDVSLTNTFATFVGSYQDFEVSGGASLSQVVSGLSPSTDYYYRLRANNASGNSLYSNTIGPVTTLDVDEVEWDGSESTDWHTAANWEYNTLPSGTIGAIIPSAPANQPKITSSTSCQYLTIEPGASVIIEGNRKTLTIADGDLIIQSNSSNTGEIAITGGGSISFTDGMAKFQQYIPGNRWVFVSVPMSGVTSDDFYLNHNPEVYLSYYNENGGYPGGNQYCEDCWSYIEPTTTGITVMRGYKMWIAGAAQTFELINATDFINGDKSYTLVSSGDPAAGYGWNLVGNPYPSHLDWDDFINSTNLAAANLENYGIYMWNGSGFIANSSGLSTGMTPNPSLASGGDLIPPFQAFFVRTDVGGGSLQFENSFRTTGSGDLYKQRAKNIQDYVRLKIVNTDTLALYDDIVVRFLQDANEQYDKIGDAYKMYGNYEIPQIYTYLEDGTELAINALPPEMKDKAIVPIGIFVAMDGTFQFTASEMESFQHEIPIKVRDLETGDVFNLNENPVFEVELDSGYYMDRFEILFGENTSIPNQLTLKNDLIRINSDNQYINIAVLGEDVQLPLTAEVFDITGKLINKTLVNKPGTSRIYMQHNVKTCVIRLTGNNINKVQKLIIN